MFSYRRTATAAQPSKHPELEREALCDKTRRGPRMPGPIDPASKCFLGGLAYATTEDSLRNYFSTFGEVRQRAAAPKSCSPCRNTAHSQELARSPSWEVP